VQNPITLPVDWILRLRVKGKRQTLRPRVFVQRDESYQLVGLGRRLKGLYLCKILARTEILGFKVWNEFYCSPLSTTLTNSTATTLASRANRYTLLTLYASVLLLASSTNQLSKSDSKTYLASLLLASSCTINQLLSCHCRHLPRHKTSSSKDY
jgi:hypothetical protein